MNWNERMRKMKTKTKHISFEVPDALPLNQTLVIPISKIKDWGIIELSWDILAMMNLVVAIDYDTSCFYIVKNRWGMDSILSLKDLKNNPIPLRCLESFLLKPDVFNMEELYQNANDYER